MSARMRLLQADSFARDRAILCNHPNVHCNVAHHTLSVIPDRAALAGGVLFLPSQPVPHMPSALASRCSMRHTPCNAAFMRSIAAGLSPAAGPLQGAASPIPATAELCTRRASHHLSAKAHLKLLQYGILPVAPVMYRLAAAAICAGEQLSLCHMVVELPKAHQQLLGTVNLKAMMCSRAGHLSHVTCPCERDVVPTCCTVVILCITLTTSLLPSARLHLRAKQQST